MAIVINPDKTLSINGTKIFPVNLYSMCYDAGGGHAECNLADKTDFDINISTWTPSVVFNTTYVYWTMRIDYPTPSNVMSRPYFFGWMQEDEPTSAELTMIQTNYNNMKVLDPAHLIILNHYQNLHTWYPYCDIMTWDTYSIRDGYYPDPVANPVPYARADAIYAYESACKRSAFVQIELNAIPKPVWAVVQANGIYHPDGLLVPTPKEARANTYSALCMDVKGITFWSYHNVPPTYVDYGTYVNQPLFAYYKQLTQELKGLNNYLLSPTIGYSWFGHPDWLTVSITPNPTKYVLYNNVNKFSYILKRTTNKYLLIVVNKDSLAASNITIRISGLTGTATATTVGLETAGSGRAGRTVSVTNGQFVDSFDGLAVHIYDLPVCTTPTVQFGVA